MDTNRTYELSRQLISSEIDEFDNNPKAFIKAMGWSGKRWNKIDVLKGQLDFTVDDINNLKSILDSSIPRLEREYKVWSPEVTIEMIESNSVCDFLSNLVAQKILDRKF